MKINKSSTESLPVLRFEKEVASVGIPNFVQERIDYFAKYLSNGLTYSDLYMLVIAEPNEEELAKMFENFFASPYLEMSREFLKWYRDPNYWKQRQVEVASAIIQIYQQKTRQERVIV